MKKIKEHLVFACNMGLTPKQILKYSNIYEGENKFIINEILKNFENKVIAYEKISNNEYI